MRWPEPSPRTDRPDAKRRYKKSRGEKLPRVLDTRQCSQNLAARRSIGRKIARPSASSFPPRACAADVKIDSGNAQACRRFFHELPPWKTQNRFNSRRGFLKFHFKKSGAVFKSRRRRFAAHFLLAAARKKFRFRVTEALPGRSFSFQFSFPKSRRVSFQNSQRVFQIPFPKSGAIFLVAHSGRSQKPSKKAVSRAIWPIKT